MTADFNQFDWHRQMIRSGDLTTTAKLVGAAMFDYSDEHGRNVFPSKAKLATDTGLSKSTVHRAIQSLRDAGWIRLVAEGGFSDQYNRPNEWRLTYPEHMSYTPKPGGCPYVDVNRPGMPLKCGPVGAGIIDMHGIRCDTVRWGRG